MKLSKGAHTTYFTWWCDDIGNLFDQRNDWLMTQMMSDIKVYLPLVVCARLLKLNAYEIKRLHHPTLCWEIVMQ